MLNNGNAFIFAIPDMRIKFITPITDKIYDIINILKTDEFLSFFTNQVKFELYSKSDKPRISEISMLLNIKKLIYIPEIVIKRRTFIFR